MPRDRETRKVVVERPGPLLVEGPVTVTCEDGREVTSDRFMVAICTCRRSRRQPWCDTSHRRRERPDRNRPAAAPPRDIRGEEGTP
ncbi:CDGSH iron-sulfur domain-containing protein [Streptomyces sp. NPDC049040]|uniref:CDGSH iron-sulfur domain-containing protein n=1 Tax=Streptomyces sp. NPDC049040 TaxID=3365593 RepID=UPI003720DFB4